MNHSLTLGQRLRELRMKRGLTQIELGTGICTPSMVSQIEADRARPSYRVLSELADKLGIPLEQLLNNVELKMETNSSYKMARSLIADKQYSAAIPILKTLLGKPTDQCSPEEVLFYLGECYLHSGRLSEASHLLQKCLDDPAFYRDTIRIRVLVNMGQIEFKRNRYQLANHYFQKALEEYQVLNCYDVHLKGNILFHLGVTHSKLGLIQDAIHFYQQSLPHYDGVESLHDMGQLYMELAESYRKANDPHHSAIFSEKAITLLEAADSQVEKMQLEMNYAAMLGETGRSEEAIEKLEMALRQFQEHDKREDMGVALVELAKIHLKLEERDKVDEYCQIARTLLSELHPYRAWVHRLQGLMALEGEQYQEAVSFLKKSADLFKISEEYGNWETTMRDLSQVYKRLHDSLRAIAILEEINEVTRDVMDSRGIVL